MTGAVLRFARAHPHSASRQLARALLWSALLPLVLTPAAGADPVSFTFSGSWCCGTPPLGGADSFDAVVVFDNGGATGESQTYDPRTDFVSLSLTAGSYTATLPADDTTVTVEAVFQTDATGAVTTGDATFSGGTDNLGGQAAVRLDLDVTDDDPAFFDSDEVCHRFGWSRLPRARAPDAAGGDARAAVTLSRSAPRQDAPVTCARPALAAIGHSALRRRARPQVDRFLGLGLHKLDSQASKKARRADRGAARSVACRNVSTAQVDVTRGADQSRRTRISRPPTVVVSRLPRSAKGGASARWSKMMSVPSSRPRRSR